MRLRARMMLQLKLISLIETRHRFFLWYCSPPPFELAVIWKLPMPIARSVCRKRLPIPYVCYVCFAAFVHHAIDHTIENDVKRNVIK